jgi:hypothetical protein
MLVRYSLWGLNFMRLGREVLMQELVGVGPVGIPRVVVQFASLDGEPLKPRLLFVRQGLHECLDVSGHVGRSLEVLCDGQHNIIHFLACRFTRARGPWGNGFTATDGGGRTLALTGEALAAVAALAVSDCRLLIIGWQFNVRFFLQDFGHFGHLPQLPRKGPDADMLLQKLE